MVELDVGAQKFVVRISAGPLGSVAIDHFIDSLSSYPPRTLVVDLGCGDAALAQALIPKSINVISFDLISTNPFVTATDICDTLPLPGSEGTSSDANTSGDERDSSAAGSQIVDVVVCSLSLMSTNWIKCIREACRILRPG